MFVLIFQQVDIIPGIAPMTLHGFHEMKVVVLIFYKSLLRKSI